MKGLFLFDTFWPYFKVAQILALFPYKKVTDPSNGMVKLEPVEAFGYVARYGLIYGFLKFVTLFHTLLIF